MTAENKGVAPQDNAALSSLLRAFQVDSLGDGDTTAGVNQLAAMAITLAKRS